MKEPQLAAEVQLAWEVMTCLGLRTTYDRRDSPCHWFNEHYGPYPAYTLEERSPRELLKQGERRTLSTRCRGMRFGVPELMSGCRKAPIMSIGINPNLTAFQHSVKGATWCYPFFDNIAKYGDHFRHRTIHQERFPLEFIKAHLVEGTQSRATDAGRVTKITPGQDNVAIAVTYEHDGPAVLRIPLDHVLLCDPSTDHGAFHKGDVLAGKLDLPDGVAVDLIQEPVGYYQQFQRILERFTSQGDAALRQSKVRIGEDACQGDMVACASPGWNAYFPDVAANGIVEECVRKRDYMGRQLAQTRPAVIVFAGTSALQMFMELYEVEIEPKVDPTTDNFELLANCLRTPYWLTFRAGSVSFKSRLVFAPHFSYADNYIAGCRVSDEAWKKFGKDHPADFKQLEDLAKPGYVGVFIPINPNKGPWKDTLSPGAKADLTNCYLDPVDTVAQIMRDEYDQGRLRLDEKGEHLVRTEGPCCFCHNELFQLEEGCQYGKGPSASRTTEDQDLDKIAIYALHGASLTCPADTVTSYWAALGAGAEGIVVGLQLTGDGSVICCPSATLQDHAGAHQVNEMSDEQLHYFDAGASFQSTCLDPNNQPTGGKGEGYPWIGRKKGAPLSYPLLTEVLALFGRRTRILLLLQGDQGADAAQALVDKTLQTIHAFGLGDRVTLIAPKDLCSGIHERSPRTPLACMASPDASLDENVRTALGVGAGILYANVEDVANEPAFSASELPVKLLLTSRQMPFAPTPQKFGAIASCRSLAGVCFGGVEACAELRTPPALIVSDTFGGSSINERTWACGYSHQNEDTRISQNDGLIIEIKDGGVYSGAAAVTMLPIFGRFDAQVDFHVENPQQGTTFEMAAIGIDPGYFHIDNTDLDSRTVNLTFDVHGAPPYASSERDEDDGFRIGWNNGYNLTQIDAKWTAASANMYNKYGRDVGIGAKDSPTGTLRLVRNGAVFNTYYKDKFNDAWVCSGSVLVSNLGPDVHIRLGAKHWPKSGNPAPGNKVTFSKFRLFQF